MTAGDEDALAREGYALAALHIAGPGLLKSLGDRAAEFAPPVLDVAAPAEEQPRPVVPRQGWIPQGGG